MNFNKQKSLRVASIVEERGGIDTIIAQCNEPTSSINQVAREMGIATSTLHRLIENERKSHLLLSIADRCGIIMAKKIEDWGGVDYIVERLKTETYYSVSKTVWLSPSGLANYLDRIGAMLPEHRSRHKYKKKVTNNGWILTRSEKPLIMTLVSAQDLRSAPWVDTMYGIDPFVRGIIERGGKLGNV